MQTSTCNSFSTTATLKGAVYNISIMAQLFASLVTGANGAKASDSRLKGKKGADFEKAYLDEQVTMHQNRSERLLHKKRRALRAFPPLDCILHAPASVQKLKRSK